MPVASEPPVIKPHILVVEDDQPIARLMEALLGSDGYLVTIVSDGESALTAIAAHRPALVLLDLTLPVLDGWEVLSRLRAQGDAPPVVLLTGDSRARGRAAAEGAAATIIKPFDVDDLLATVERLLAAC
jgi:DNA-binding response OmpR family regulator